MSEGKTAQQQRVRRVNAARPATKSIERAYVDLEIVLERGSADFGPLWRALFQDRHVGHVSALGVPPWEAISWAIVDSIVRRFGIVMLARNGEDTPLTFLRRVLDRVEVDLRTAQLRAAL